MCAIMINRFLNKIVFLMIHRSYLLTDVSSRDRTRPAKTKEHAMIFFSVTFSNFQILHGDLKKVGIFSLSL